MPLPHLILCTLIYWLSPEQDATGEFMVRWIAQPNDASKLSKSNLQVETAVDPIRSALGQPSAVIVLPSARPGEAILASVRNLTAQQVDERRQGRKVASYAATGLLGLDDEPIYEDEKPQGWWKRLMGA